MVTKRIAWSWLGYTHPGQGPEMGWLGLLVYTFGSGLTFGLAPLLASLGFLDTRSFLLYILRSCRALMAGVPSSLFRRAL